jgi:hypothetical protein
MTGGSGAGRGIGDRPKSSFRCAKKQDLCDHNNRYEPILAITPRADGSKAALDLYRIAMQTRQGVLQNEVIDKRRASRSRFVRLDHRRAYFVACCHELRRISFLATRQGHANFDGLSVKKIHCGSNRAVP